MRSSSGSLLRPTSSISGKSPRLKPVLSRL
jgi:hypothetical protein